MNLRSRPAADDPTRLAPPRSRWRWAAVLLVVAAPLLASSSASAADPVGCDYGTEGPYAPNLCWFDMTGYSDAQARSATGQEMSITLPGGYAVDFTLTSRAVPGTNWRGVLPRAAPLEDRFAFGFGGYVGIAGKPVLYSQPGSRPNGVELKLSDIRVVDSGGQPVTGYSFVIADAENNVAGEDFTWTSDKPLNLLGVLNEQSASGCHNGLSGLGTTSVTCTGQGGEPGLPNPRYDAVIVGADTPSSIALSMTTFAQSGVAFAIMTSKVQLTKDVVGRVRTTDSFDISVTSPEGSTLATATTGPADTATTGELTVLPLSSGASYTLAEAATPASGTRPSDYSRSWSCTNNGLAEPSLPSGSDPSVSVLPEAGDFIACTVANTQLPADLSVEKDVSAASAAAGDPIAYTVEVENEGPSGADSVLLEDVLPAGVAYVSDDASCDAGAPPAIQCQLGALLAGESRSVQIVGEVQPGAAGSLQTNSAKVSALQPDDEPIDDEDSASTAVAPFADLAITKSVNPELVSAFGESVVYTLLVENKGESQSSATTVTDTLPAGLRYDSDDGGCDATALPTITCDLGALDKGESRTIHLVAEVEASAAGQTIENTAAVSGPIFDPDQTDNEDSAPLEVEPLSDPVSDRETETEEKSPAPPSSPAPPAPPASPAPLATPKKTRGKKRPPRLVVSKRARRAKARPGSVIGYRIAVANRGGRPARRVLVCDHPPTTQRVLRTRPRARGKARRCWKLAKLPAGAKRVFKLTAMVDLGSRRGAQRNRATVRAANARRVRRAAAAVRVKPLPRTRCLAGSSGAGLLPQIDLFC